MGMQIVPLPVSFKGIEVSEMLRAAGMVPRPRLNHTLVKGWWNST